MGGAIEQKSFSTFRQAWLWVEVEEKEALEKVNLYLTYVSIEWQSKIQKFVVFLRFTK